MEIKEKIIDKIKSLSDSALEDISESNGYLSLTINSHEILNVSKLLYEDEDLQFVMCKDVTAVDWAARKDRFTVVYHIFSLLNNFELRLKANLKDKEESIESVTSVWHSANWYERETYDMYGINFKNHPDLRRMYMPEEFEYYPLRKDFPILGIPGSLPLPKKEES
ncbi:MAG: NADH-quinone oxidoreductase subunit C [Melioribacteraceae bacterium]|nr:NADH-quinone oxidoreductase subunit C [Melioribacteraceae bacterium]MCF8355327.1 NADH-quinone oxidoreductase subunit C [Melioribacteraceae bacterium]MCF8396336.1 NADH-quinone oxidoreductase subunit C [Melioribacteraceae bacterium]MCF8420405.1 NADH-quinone oxidoreductase subunit C [Melioribacteraceae bacterium]